MPKQTNLLKQVANLLKPIQRDLNTLKKDFGTVKSDIGTLKTDAGTLNSDIKSLKTDVKVLQAHNIRMENKLFDMDQKFDKNLKQWKSELYDKIDPILKRVTSAEEENTILRAREEGKDEVKEDLEKRIKKLEGIHPQNLHVPV